MTDELGDELGDELWPHFAPLWTDLRTIAPRLLLAGGYALFLKQQWLISHLRFLGTNDDHFLVTEKGEKLIVDEGVRTLVAIHRWKDQTPRVTKDFDFIANLDLIASEKEQLRIHEALQKHDFNAVPENARWQFDKKVSAGRTVGLDFHAPSPTGNRDDLRVQSRRVKPQRALKQTGIHGRENPEAISSELHPFCFTYSGMDIALPHAVTLAMMKLIAMRDRWRASQDASKSAVQRDHENRQAMKHAEDVCRVMAMVTREESEHAGSVLDATRGTPGFSAAAETFSSFFQKEEDWGSQVVADRWQADDFQIIQNTLATWFK